MGCGEAGLEVRPGLVDTGTGMCAVCLVGGEGRYRDHSGCHCSLQLVRFQSVTWKRLPSPAPERLCFPPPCQKLALLTLSRDP
jgi:hypothetical protein